MGHLRRVLSRVSAKPRAFEDLDTERPPQLDEDGHLTFHDHDVDNPKNWTNARRWYVTLVAVSMVTNATFASSAPSGCIGSISRDFNVSTTSAQLTVSIFLIGYCAGPLVFAPLSEFYGRRYLFLMTFSGYAAFNFLCAFAPNFAALLIGRFLTGTLVSSALSNSPGVLADIWHPIDRGNAMAVFSCATNIGPALGPIVAGFLELSKGWRWCFYVLLWLAGGTLLLLLTLPETLPNTVLLHKAQRLRRAKISGFEQVRAPVETTDRSLAALFKVALVRPWIILFDPISFLIAIYMSVIYTLLYMLFTIYPIVFQQRRGWNTGVGELPLLGTALGPCLGGTIVWYNSRRSRQKAQEGHQAKPEDRLPLAMIGGVGFALTMFWFAWTAEFDSIHWMVPTVAGVFLTASIMLIFVTCLNYLTDTYTIYAASAVAANTVIRSACGAAAPLFTQKMFDALGVGGGGSLIGGVATLCAIIPFAFYKYGENIRLRSRFVSDSVKAKIRGSEATAVDSSKGLKQ